MKKIYKLVAALLVLCCITNIPVLAGDIDMPQEQEETQEESIHIYITITDISDYTNPLDIIVPRTKIEVTNFDLAEFGDTMPEQPNVDGISYLHALVQFHRNKYGDEGVPEYFILDPEGNTARFLGREVASIMYKNGNDIFDVPQNIPLNDNDEIQVCLYDVNHNQRVSMFSTAHEVLAIDEPLSLSLLQHYGSPQLRDGIANQEIVDEYGVYVLDKEGNVITTDDEGNFEVAFGAPGTYTLSAMPEINYYLPEDAGEIYTAYVPHVTEREEIVHHYKKIGTETQIYNAPPTSWLAKLREGRLCEVWPQITTVWPPASSVFVFNWDDYEEELSPDDPNYQTRTIYHSPEWDAWEDATGTTWSTAVPEGSSVFSDDEPRVVEQVAIVEDTPETIIHHDVVTEEVTRIRPATLALAAAYTTPLCTIEVIADLIVENVSCNWNADDSNIVTIFGNVKNSSYNPGNCYIAYYKEGRLVHLDKSTISSELLTTNAVDCDEVKVMFWNASTEPYREALHFTRGAN